MCLTRRVTLYCEYHHANTIKEGLEISFYTELESQRDGEYM